MTKRLVFLLISLLAAGVLMGCESDATQDRRAKAEAERKVDGDEQDRQDAQSHQAALTALALAKQHDLDGVEQQRTGNVYAHSCRKAVAFDPAYPVSVDTKACTQEQLALEQEAERRQMFDDAMKKKQ